MLVVFNPHCLLSFVLSSYSQCGMFRVPLSEVGCDLGVNSSEEEINVV